MCEFAEMFRVFVKKTGDGFNSPRLANSTSLLLLSVPTKEPRVSIKEHFTPSVFTPTGYIQSHGGETYRDEVSYTCNF